MARDGWRRRASGRPDTPNAGPSPVDQLEQWREWRHDTAEFPAVVGPDLAQQHDEELSTPAAGRRRAVPPAGWLVGGALLAVALVLSGLAATGVSPVARLLGPQPADEHPSTPRPTSLSTPTGSRAGAPAPTGPPPGGAHPNPGPAPNGLAPNGPAPRPPRP